ncbi:MAG: CHAT domain-containing protein, partial [Phycisphaerales bacterium]|nr:CHAT domain-containing protein [Phycisphaerales bacterium]
YPRHTGLVVFVAGPAQLAFLVGRAVNPRIHGSADFPHFVGPDYVAALRYPPPEEIPRILILTANPHDQKNIRDGQEIRDIKQMLRGSLAGRIVEPEVETSVTPEDFLAALNHHQPHILHISAHGSEVGEIGLVKDDGTMSKAPPDGMMRALLAAGKSVRLIILNACYSEVLAKQLADHFDYVIGVKDPLYTTTAIAFAKGFYAALGAGKNLAEAFAQGQALPALKDLWGTDRIQAFPRPGFDPTSWIPFPARLFVQGA